MDPPHPAFPAASGGPGSETCISVQYAAPPVRLLPGETLGVLITISPLHSLGYSTVPPAMATYTNGDVELLCGPATGAGGFGAGILASPAAPAGRIRFYILEECLAYANCDRSFYRPALNVNDFVCFNETFAAGCAPTEPCYPNCDQPTTPPVLNVLDFICFLNAYARGCTAP